MSPDDPQAALWLSMGAHRRMSGSKGCCPLVYRVLKWLWMDDSPLSRGAAFLISDSDWSMSPTNCHPMDTAPLFLLPVLQPDNFNLFLEGVCVCMCVCLWGGDG